MLKVLLALCIASVVIPGCIVSGKKEKLFSLSAGVSVFSEQNADGKWGISVRHDRGSFVFQENPLHIEIFGQGDTLILLDSGYDRIILEKEVATGRGTVHFSGVSFHFADVWSREGGTLKVDRKVQVGGSMSGGFMSAIRFTCRRSATRESVRIFAPGMIYGTTDHLTEQAIGGSLCTDFILIREDRLPAPLFGLYFEDGRSVTILNSKPDSRTTREDSREMEAGTLVDEDFRFGSIGADFKQQHPGFGYWFPGSEGGITYKGRTYPYGQMEKWSRRYHPLQDGLEQEYQVSFRFTSNDVFSDYYSGAWRWAWSVLKPALSFHDIEVAKRSLLNMLGERIESHNGITGISNFIPAPEGMEKPVDRHTIMGFTGKTLETAGFLLIDYLEEDNPLGEKHRMLGESIVQTFLELGLSPPAGEGFSFEGETVVAIYPRDGQEPVVYLRSFGDGLKALLKTVQREKLAGREHEEWIEWARTFADWLLPQQGESGGFPRTWKQGTGEVQDISSESSYTVIPYLVLLSELTGDSRYVEAAGKAGEFCWNTAQSGGVFIGGTIDNPNVIDKEAGTLSLEAYLSLYHYTSEKKWLDRAIMAGRFSETWIYIWEVPMPEDETDRDLHWKKGISTAGMQLISTGHSLTDQYMAFDADEFAELFLLTGDNHFYDVAMILLHNTKSMLGLPGREFDLKGEGWQQEHWSLAPVRGVGIHRGWLPWVSTSHLNGIIELQELDDDLYQAMTSTVSMRYTLKQQAIVVDGIAADWEPLEGVVVETPEKLWIGQGMLAEHWEGKDDLSFIWKACWHQNKIYFLFKVRDDRLVEPAVQPNSYLNDCIEILLDPCNRQGPRYTEKGGQKELLGYEMHFLPAAPNHVFVDDSMAPMYPLQLAQDSLFRTAWKGEIACTKETGSYLVELGFEIPGLIIHPGVVIGMDLNVCDDDGRGRESLMIWSGTQNEFWLTMDEYPKLFLKE